MTEGLKWTVNQIPKSDDKFLDLMSEENVAKANEFHKSFPQYTVTPLQKLSALASYLLYCHRRKSRTRRCMGCQSSWAESSCKNAEGNHKNKI